LFKDNYLTLDLIDQKGYETCWQQLVHSDSIIEKHKIVEEYLIQNLDNHKSADIRIVDAVNQILSERPGVTVNDICQNLNVSRKHLNVLFKKYVGVSPKSFILLSRFQDVLQLLASKSEDDIRLSDIAYEMNYFDQAHFIKEFKSLTRLSPSCYLSLLRKAPSMKNVPHFIPENEEVTFLQFIDR